MEQKNILLVNRGFRDINPLNVGAERCSVTHSYGPAVREYYLIHYVVSGHGTFQIDDKEFYLSGGDMFFISPQQVTTYYADPKNPWSYIWVGFESTLELMDIFSRNVISSRECGSIFNDLLECENFGEYAEMLACSKIYELIAHLKKTGLTDKNQMERYALMAKNYIETNYEKNLSVADIAKQLGLDRSYFSTVFKEKIGKSPQQYIVDYRLEKAAYFMEVYHYTPLQAAQYCGYPDLFNFSKMFKKKYGVSPRYYCDRKNKEREYGRD